MLSEFEKELTYCTFCPKLCKFACPVAVATGREDVTPTSKMQFAYFILRGMEDLDDPEYNSIFYQCTTCTACSSYCDHEIDVSRVLLEAKREVSGRGIIPPEAVRIRDSVLRFRGSPYSRPLSVRERVKKFVITDAQVILFPGYTAVNEYPVLIERFFRVMEELGINYVALYENFFSSGYPLYSLGFQQEFISFARNLYKELSGYRLIITLDPSDAWILRNIFGELGFYLHEKVKTIDEFLNEISENIREKIKEPVFESYSYHDPCYLGRYAGLYELPRKVLSLIFKRKVENPWWGKDSFCCGRGGMYFLIDPEGSRKVARVRRSHFENLSIDAVVTSCPGGVVQLRSAGRGLKVWHIVDALYFAIQELKNGKE